MKYLARRIEHVDLDEQAGTAMAAEVERRSLDLSLGRRGGRFSVRLEWLRPLAIDVRTATGTRQYSLATAADPWRRALLGILVLWLTSVLVTALFEAKRSRGARR